jgi:conjugal transfer/entry exclusion protein
MQRKWYYSSLGVLGALLVNPFQVFGILGVGDLVYDGANHVENVLMVAEGVKQTAHQASMVINQVQQLWYDAQNLTSITDILRVAQACGLGMPSMGLGVRLPFSCHEVLALFKDIYGGAWDGSDLLYGPALHRWTQTAYTAAEDASRAQGLQDALRQDAGELAQALGRSHAAVGALDAQQAQTQVVALQTQIALRHQELAMVTGRMEATRQAMQAASVAHMQAQGAGLAAWDGLYTRTAVTLPTFQ